MSSPVESAAAERVRPDPGQVALALRRWLFSGSCQSTDGAFCAWRDASTGRLAFAYPEINGYLLTFAGGLADLSPAELDAARRAADWLLRRLAQNDLSARPGWDGGAIYTFDLAMVATGLFSFGRRFGRRYLDAGARLVELLGDETRVGGRLPAVARGPSASHTGWASEGRAHLLKAVQCFLLADEVAGAGPAGRVRALIEEARRLQRADGSFVTQPGDGITMLHPHLYALEGLWIWGAARSEGWALDRARAGLRWALRTQLPTGGFPRFAGARDRGEPGPEQGDVTAQAVRLARLLDVDGPGLDRAARRLTELALGDGRERAVVYQPAPAPKHENVWATLFAAQALGGGSAGARLSWRELV